MSLDYFVSDVPGRSLQPSLTGFTSLRSEAIPGGRKQLVIVGFEWVDEDLLKRSTQAPKCHLLSTMLYCELVIVGEARHELEENERLICGKWNYDVLVGHSLLTFRVAA